MTSARTVRVEWREGLVEEYAWLAERTRGTVSCIELELQLPWIDAIRRLKAEVGATILAHNYQSPEIFHGVADITGDSLALADAAGRCDFGHADRLRRGVHGRDGQAPGASQAGADTST